LFKLGVTSNFRLSFTFNGGSEADNEISGLGNSLTTHFRELDTRLGRWWTIDPKIHAWQSPYSAMDNNPINFVDPLGDETPKKPKPVKKGDNYYKDRLKDFKTRNPNRKAPEYYLNYGNKYLRRFKYETKQTLSKKGQKWLDKALINLQDEMEKGLEQNKNIELNNEKFTDFAFDTHVNAYEKAGILKLGVVDKVKIMLTVDPKDLLSPGGLKQAGIVASHQMELYAKEPKFALKQATELYQNQVVIANLVLQYAEKHGINPDKVMLVIKSPFIQ
jgi:RHS repeat-associated protein